MLLRNVMNESFKRYSDTATENEIKHYLHVTSWRECWEEILRTIEQILGTVVRIVVCPRVPDYHPIQEDKRKEWIHIDQKFGDSQFWAYTADDSINWVHINWILLYFWHMLFGKV